MDNKKVEVKDRYEIYKKEIENLKENTKGMDQFYSQFLMMKALMKKLGHNPTWLLNSHDEAGNPIELEKRKFLLRQTIDAIFEENVEMLRELDWKHWKKYKTEDLWYMNEEKKENLLDEIVDMLHFIYQFAILLGYDSDDVHMAFMVKHIENFGRQDRGY